MFQQQLRQHQWKAFRRNPMFERNLAVRIFMCFMFGLLAIEFMSFGFVLDTFLVKVGPYERAIDTFNSIFDGLAARKTSILELLKSKYILYCSYSLLVTLLLLIPAFQGKISGFLLMSLFFYVTGPIFFNFSERCL